MDKLFFLWKNQNPTTCMLGEMDNQIFDYSILQLFNWLMYISRKKKKKKAINKKKYFKLFRKPDKV